MVKQSIEQEAQRLFKAHSPLIRGCIDRFSTYARSDGNSRVALGFMPLSPEKYTLLSQMYQSVHQVLASLYRIYKDGVKAASLNDWLALLQFDGELIRKNPHSAQVFSAADQALLLQFDGLGHDLLTFRLTFLKEILTLARQEAFRAHHAGDADALPLLEAVSDRMLDAVQQAEHLRREQCHATGSEIMESRTGRTGIFGALRRVVA